MIPFMQSLSTCKMIQKTMYRPIYIKNILKMHGHEHLSKRITSGKRGKWDCYKGDLPMPIIFCLQKESGTNTPECSE